MKILCCIILSLYACLIKFNTIYMSSYGFFLCFIYFEVLVLCNESAVFPRQLLWFSSRTLVCAIFQYILHMNFMTMYIINTFQSFLTNILLIVFSRKENIYNYFIFEVIHERIALIKTLGQFKQSHYIENLVNLSKSCCKFINYAFRSVIIYIKVFS